MRFTNEGVLWMATPSEMKYTCAARPSTLGKCGSALLDDIVSISLRTSLRSVVNADAVTSAVSSTRNSVVGPPLSSSDFALSAACCHRVFPSEALVFIVGEVSSTMTMRSFFPVSDSISGLASDNAISSAIVAAIGFDSLAIFVELRAICSKQGRCNGDFAADVVFRIDELEFASQHRIDFFVTGNVDDENIVPDVPQDIQRAFKPISVKHVRDDNGQASPARLCAICFE